MRSRLLGIGTEGGAGTPIYISDGDARCLT